MLQRENLNEQQLIETMNGKRKWSMKGNNIDLELVAHIVKDILSFKIKVIQLKAMLVNKNEMLWRPYKCEHCKSFLFFAIEAIQFHKM